jgi:hypothetical protein
VVPTSARRRPVVARTLPHFVWLIAFEFTTAVDALCAFE